MTVISPGGDRFEIPPLYQMSLNGCGSNPQGGVENSFVCNCEMGFCDFWSQITNCVQKSIFLVNIQIVFKNKYIVKKRHFGQKAKVITTKILSKCRNFNKKLKPLMDRDGLPELFNRNRPENSRFNRGKPAFSTLLPE